MLGMDRLIQLRRNGYRPELLTMFTPKAGGTYACEGSVHCQEADRPSLTDLRAMRDLTVVVLAPAYQGFEEAEVWARAVIASGAKSVALAMMMPREEGGGLDGPVWIHVNGETLA